MLYHYPLKNKLMIYYSQKKKKYILIFIFKLNLQSSKVLNCDLVMRRILFYKFTLTNA